MVDPVDFEVNGDDNIDNTNVPGSPEWKEKRSPQEQYNDYIESYVRRWGERPQDTPVDVNEWSKHYQEQIRQDYANFTEGVLASTGHTWEDFQKKMTRESPNANLRQEGGVIKAGDVALIKWDNYHHMNKGQRDALHKLIAKVGSVSNSSIRADRKAQKERMDQEVELAKKTGKHQLDIKKKYMGLEWQDIKQKGKILRKQDLDTSRQTRKIAEEARVGQYKIPYDYDRILVNLSKGVTIKKGEVSLKEKNPKTNKTYKDEGWSEGETIIGYDSFLKKFDKIEDSEWKHPAKCVSHLQNLYSSAGIPTTLDVGGYGGLDITTQCQEIARSLGSSADKERASILGKTRAYKEAEKMEKQIDLQDEIDDLIGVAADLKSQLKAENKGTKSFDLKYENIMNVTDKKSQKRQLANFLAGQKVSKPGFMEGVKAKIKVKAGIFPGLEKLRKEGSEVAYQRKMGSLLNTIRSSGTSAAKRVTLTSELQATFDAAESAGFTPQAAVTGYLQSRPEGSEVISPLSEEDESGGKLDVLKDVGSTIGSSVSEATHGLGETIGGNTGNSMSDIGGEMSNIAKSMTAGSTDLDQFGSSMGKSGGPLESMSTEHQDDGPVHGSMRLKSVTLGKTTVGSGSLFEASMADSGAGVKMGDWDPYAFKQDEPRGEKFLRERGAETTGEGGPLGGDLTPGSMSFDFTAGAGPGTRKLDLGSGQFAGTQPPYQDISSQQRTPLDLGLGSSFGMAIGLKSVAEAGGIGIGAHTKLPSHSKEDKYQSYKGNIDDSIVKLRNGRADEPQVTRLHGHDDHLEPQRVNLNLGLKSGQKPTTGVNLLGLGNVKAPSVTTMAGKGNGNLINQATIGIGLDSNHLIGNTPKKKRKMNLFGGMPR